MAGEFGRSRRIVLAAALSAAVMTLVAPQGRAQEEGVTLLPGGEVTTPKLQFREHCAPCHGIEGAGDGPLAKALKTSPTDLTLLAQRNGGKFPHQMVFDTIKGNRLVESHGTREMPIWGQIFAVRRQRPGAPGRSEQEADKRIELIVKYIESIQKK